MGVWDIDGRDATIADFSEMTYAIYKGEDRDAVASGSLTVADVMFDERQLDGMWTKDDIGYNFIHRLDHTQITTHGPHRIEYVGVVGATEVRAKSIRINAEDMFTE
jgi:hypothetical protein